MPGRQNNPDLDEDKAEPCRSKVLSQKSCVFKTLSSTLLLLHILLYARGGINFMAIKNIWRRHTRSAQEKTFLGK